MGCFVRRRCRGSLRQLWIDIQNFDETTPCLGIYLERWNITDHSPILQLIMVSDYQAHLDTKGSNGLPHTSDQASQRAVSRRPFRSFTKLSARALAVHLASQDCAEKRLCPYLPAQNDHGNLGIDQSHGRMSDPYHSVRPTVSQ